MPFPNNHACLINPNIKVKGSVTRRHNGKRYTVRVGEGGERSYLYPTDEWSAEAASAHCRAHDGKFEPASAKVRETEGNYADPLLNPFIKVDGGK